MKVIAEDLVTVLRIVKKGEAYGAPSLFEVSFQRFGDEATLYIGRGIYTQAYRALIKEELEKRGIKTWRFARVKDGERRIVAGRVGRISDRIEIQPKEKP